MSPFTTQPTVITDFETRTKHNTNALEQLRATAALAAKKRQEAEEASHRAAVDLHRAEEEASRRAAEDRQRAEKEAKTKAKQESQRRAAKKKRAQVENKNSKKRSRKKTGAKFAHRCTACTKAKSGTACTFSARRSTVIKCDRCRSMKIACTFPGEVKKSEQEKRTVDEVKSPRESKGKKKSRHQSPMEVEEAADERTSVVADLEVLARKVGQLTDVVEDGFSRLNDVIAEGFASNRTEQQLMITTLDMILGVLTQYREETAAKESIKNE
ncbi:hypothetical protein DFH29DRAFT_945431 [Suillus ampliporus]|nr:hypothetical protein DFH29DRAFT_945431 [Suillus ampliporus]